MSARGQGRVDLDVSRSQLEQVGLVHAAERLAELLDESVKGNEPAHHFLDRLLAAESSEREMRRIKTSLRLSGLPPGLTLGSFDFAFQRRSRRAGSKCWRPAPGSASTQQ